MDATQPQHKGPDRRVGLTPTRIIDEALRLSRVRGLDAWKVRDLAAELDVAPSVIYHHIGSKPQIIREVVNRIALGFSPPGPDLEWQEFFRTLLRELYPVLLEYPGVAKWMVMHGPSFPALRHHFDVGLSALRRAGFSKPAMTYAMIVNSAVLTVMMTDERREQGEDGPRDHASMRREFEVNIQESPGVSQMISELLVPLSEDPEGAGRRLNAEYYRLLVESLILGLERQLA